MTLFLGGLALLAAGAASSLVLRGSRLTERVYLALVAAGCATASVPAVRVLITGAPVAVRWHSGLPGGDWVLGLDPLSSIFVLTVLGAGLANAAFGLAYLGADRERHPAGASHALFAFTLAAMALVVTAHSATLFLCVWELMAIGSYFLIVTEHEHASVRSAGFIYLVATHAATLALFAMFALWGSTSGDWTFAGLAAARPALAAGGGVVLALALLGFGVKAGMVPFHFWLPGAHAAAPSHVSALMSGVVIKMGIYGVLRAVTIAGVPPRWWGWTVLGLGVASALLGVLWALAQHDVKRLLAYHSVENIGIILIAVGIGALAASYGNPALAVLGYGAAALHTLNHALFKSALFLGAGAVYRRTGSRNLEALGGLARRMPLTWLAFVIAAAAIIGVPPLNGFVSEWLVYQGLFRAGLSAGAIRLAVLAAPALALVGGLALACFAKAGGAVFLGRPRSDAAATATEVGAGYLVPLFGLSGACLAIGLLPAVFVRPVLMVGANVAGVPWQTGAPAVAEVLGDAQWIALVAAALVLAGSALWIVRGLALRRRSVRSAETWGCGYQTPAPRAQYTASSFAAPLVAVFGALAGIHEHRGATVFHTTPADLVLDGVAFPAWNRLQRLALRLRPMQQGRLHFYLLYMVAAVGVVLVYFVVAPRP